MNGNCVYDSTQTDDFKTVHTCTGPNWSIDLDCETECGRKDSFLADRKKA